MKKFLVAIMAVLFSAPSFAQYSSGGFNLSESSVYYGIRLGINFATLTGDAPDLGTKTGLNFGGTVGLRLSDTAPVFLESGLYYTGCGASKDKNSISLNYLELPILIKYGVQLNDDIAILPFIGPTFRYGLFGGKWKTSGAGKVDSFGDGKFKRADMGIKLGCGAEYNKLYAELGYQFGITNIADWQVANGDDASAHNGAFFFNVGVNF
ncbi:MAG: porin family protein [Prevotella sp.]|nr:porin family protein [Prevotella sp.]